MIFISSLVFYFWTQAIYVPLLIFMVLFNFFGGILIYRFNKNLIFLLILIVDVGVLGYFKYALFLATELDKVIKASLSSPFQSLVLPIGISFFTFQAISYIFDIRRGTIKPETNPWRFGAYLTFFPQLIAGPIVRYSEVSAYFRDLRTSMNCFCMGATRFAHGLAKKILIADPVGQIADRVFLMPSEALTFTDSWVGAAAYTVQIYFDFSGYSDMAIGLALIFGIRLPENFMRPYSTSTLTEFWRRWHMTLSRWFRDYVYISLGGGHHGVSMTYRNLLLVFILAGFWHGASYTFVAWGLYHGAFLIFERLAFKESRKHYEKSLAKTMALRLFYLIPVVMVGWVIFRANSLSHAIDFLMAMVPTPSALMAPFSSAVISGFGPQIIIPFGIGLVSLFAPRNFVMGVWLMKQETASAISVKNLYAVSALVLSTIVMLTSTYRPFLYFQF